MEEFRLTAGVVPGGSLKGEVSMGLIGELSEKGLSC